MVVHQVDIVGVAIVKAEDDPPVAGNRDAPELPPIALEWVKPISGQVEVRWSAGIVEVRQRHSEALRLVGTNPASVASLVQPLETPMTKASNHSLLYRIPVRASTRVGLNLPRARYAVRCAPRALAMVGDPIGETRGADQRPGGWRRLCPAFGRVIHTVGQVGPRSSFNRTHTIPSTCSKRRSADTRSAPVSMA